jgi:hypothetical protein
MEITLSLAFFNQIPNQFFFCWSSRTYPEEYSGPSFSSLEGEMEDLPDPSSHQKAIDPSLANQGVCKALRASSLKARHLAFKSTG